MEEECPSLPPPALESHVLPHVCPIPEQERQAEEERRRLGMRQARAFVTEGYAHVEKREGSRR